MDRIILDKETVDRTLKRLSYEIMETNSNLDEIALVAIKSGGVEITKRIYNNIKKETSSTMEYHEVDIAHFRDDERKSFEPIKLEANFKDKIIILCDDVIQTGRSARAAIDAVISCGRPKRIRLLSLIDRGLRELPLKLDYVGKNIPTNNFETVVVDFVDEEKYNSSVILK